MWRGISGRRRRSKIKGWVSHRIKGEKKISLRHGGVARSHLSKEKLKSMEVGGGWRLEYLKG